MLLLMLALLQPPSVDDAIVNARVELAIEAAKKKPAMATASASYSDMRKRAIDTNLPLVVCIGKDCWGNATRGCVTCCVETFVLASKKINNGYIIATPSKGELYYTKTVVTWDDVMTTLQPPMPTQKPPSASPMDCPDGKCYPPGYPFMPRPQVALPFLGNCKT